MKVILIVIIILIFILSIIEDYNCYKNLEGFNDNYYLLTHTQYPFWNSQIGTTKNMSYDLRGDIPLNYYYIGPWNISSYYPIQNKPLYMIS